MAEAETRGPRLQPRERQEPPVLGGAGRSSAGARAGSPALLSFRFRASGLQTA